MRGKLRNDGRGKLTGFSSLKRRLILWCKGKGKEERDRLTVQDNSPAKEWSCVVRKLSSAGPEAWGWGGTHQAGSVSGNEKARIMRKKHQRKGVATSNISSTGRWRTRRQKGGERRVEKIMRSGGITEISGRNLFKVWGTRVVRTGN